MRSNLRYGAAAALALLLAALPATAESTGTFAIVTDIHFDPFDPPDIAKTLVDADPSDWAAHFAALDDQKAAQWGSDTNYALFASALGAIAKTTADVDFVIMPGDFLSHGFPEDVAKIFGNDADTIHPILAEKTALFVADALAKAMPDKPILFALGNTDSNCGDYEIEPGGAFLSATRDMVRRFAGADRLAADFDQTYDAGGYYTARHPTVANTVIIVINDILWSPKYANRCGADGDAAGQVQMDWLSKTLAVRKAAGERVWIVHHIPLGMDSYSTEHSKAETCPAKVIPHLRASFSAQLLALVAEYADIIDVSFSGHIHTDDFRVVVDADGHEIAADKISPAISPIFGQNPGFQVFTYDPATGVPTDYTTYHLTDLPDVTTSNPGTWREEYVFSAAYGLGPYSTQSVAALWNGLDEPGHVRDVYLRNYNDGHEPLAVGDLAAYRCAMGWLTKETFTDCYCGDPKN
ncbi:metallophosphoesterase [Bauldia sp.]|uniref:metallophosphoesterase n=1 Tax=Bauldia sp. TaxID=2575872 RepID=UPI003BAD96F4